MIKISELKNLQFTILGGARSGLSCAKLLKKMNLNVFLSDSGLMPEESQLELKKYQIPFENEGHSETKILSSSDILIISPGIPLNHPLILKAKKSQLIVVSEIEVASWFFPENIICVGITGTNGKSTTTNYLSSLLHLEYHAVACGNIGKPVSEVLIDIIDNNLTIEPYYLVIELSSYQLETTYSFSPACTCFINFQFDHLDRYENMDEYFKAKWRLILLTKENGLCIVNENILKYAVDRGYSLPKSKIIIVNDQFLTNDENSEHKHHNTHSILSKKIHHGISLPTPIYKELRNLKTLELLYFKFIENTFYNYTVESNSADIKIYINGKYHNWNIKKCCLQGKHNVINILNASLIAQFLKIPVSKILRQWEKDTTKYHQLSNRLEIIGEENKEYCDSSKNFKTITIVNDSKATNVESTLVALLSFHKPIRLLLGGKPKGENYEILGNAQNAYPIIIYPFGEAASKIIQDLNNSKNKVNSSSINMLAAANKALDDANDGDVILLSPACSSFDEFKDYEQRGSVFRQWAVNHFKENKI